MDCIIFVLIVLIIMLFIHFSVQVISFGVPEQIQHLKKLLGPKYRIRKQVLDKYPYNQIVHVVQKRFFGIWTTCHSAVFANILDAKLWIEKDIENKIDEIVEVNIDTTSTVTINE